MEISIGTQKKKPSDKSNIGIQEPDSMTYGKNLHRITNIYIY